MNDHQYIGRQQGLDEAIAIVRDQRETFEDPAYAGGPVGAWGELFACTEILAALELAKERAA